MKILNSSFLRGPNIYNMKPCFVADVDLEGHQTISLETLQDTAVLLRKLMPDAAAQLAIDASQLAHLLARLLFAVQVWVGNQPAFCDAFAVQPSARKKYRLLCGYQNEVVAEEALRLSVRFISAILNQQQFDLEGRLDDLKIVANATAFASSAIFTLNYDGRIPVIAVTGTNGKTTTTQLISHVLHSCGMYTGTTTTQGIYINGRCVETGDCSGYWSARRVLTDDSVQIATLETARGGILKRGLAFNYCDVGLVLNVSSDHLGLDGIETLQDLAQVKGLVARCARDSAVLNADDDLCVAMRESLADHCKAVFFAMSPDNKVLREHLSHGGAGAFLSDDDWLVWCDKNQYAKVVKATDLPVTMQGRARYNIANALAALAALCCLGFDTDVIAASLMCFISNAQNNPLRGNLFEVEGIKLIVDYAHNPVAYRALSEMAQSMRQGGARLLGVVTAPGDRRREDLYETGQVCGQYFDELIVYEHHPRGRKQGANSAEILRGARSIAPDKPMHNVLKIRHALWRGLAAAKPGDVVVFTCAGTLEDLVAGIRLKNTAEADRIALEVST